MTIVLKRMSQEVDLSAPTETGHYLVFVVAETGREFRAEVGEKGVENVFKAVQQALKDGKSTSFAPSVPPSEEGEDGGESAGDGGLVPDGASVFGGDGGEEDPELMEEPPPGSATMVLDDGEEGPTDEDDVPSL
jgi:hypothetical protein